MTAERGTVVTVRGERLTLRLKETVTSRPGLPLLPATSTFSVPRCQRAMGTGRLSLLVLKAGPYPWPKCWADGAAPLEEKVADIVQALCKLPAAIDVQRQEDQAREWSRQEEEALRWRREALIREARGAMTRQRGEEEGARQALLTTRAPSLAGQ